MRGISQKLIESIAQENVGDFAEAVEEKVKNVCSSAIGELSLSVPFVNIDKTLLQPVNENFNGSVSAESEYIYFLAIESPQIEINCLQYNDWWKKLKERFVFAWNASKKKKRRKKNKGQKETENPYNFQAEKYNLEKFSSDLQIALSHNLTETSIVYNQGKSLKIIGIDDFGPNTKIIIFPVLLEEGTYKFLINKRKGFYKINFENREKLVNDKFERVGDNFIKMIKIINALIRNSTRTYVRPNQIYVESLLYNTPDELFAGDNIYDIFIKIINYLNFSDISQFKSILNPEMTLAEDKATRTAIANFSRVLSGLNNINNNDKI